MSETDPAIHEVVQAAHQDLRKIGEIGVAFADVERLTCYPDKTCENCGEEVTRHENDSEHSYLLAVAATELAASYYPELDSGLVTQFSLVHDLPELRIGDTPSYNISPEEKAIKEETEKQEVEYLLTVLPAYLANLLKRYEEQKEPEARFVRLVDKLLPAVVHEVAVVANRRVFLGEYRIETIEELEENSNSRATILREQFPEFDIIHLLRQLTSATSRRALFPNQ